MTKAGTVSSTTPSSVFPSVFGRAKDPTAMTNAGTKFGVEAQKMKACLNISHPFSGNITNWEDVETMWHHTFYNEMRVVPEESQVLLSDKHTNTKENRE